MKCKNTECKNEIGGEVIGINREFCTECEYKSQRRVAAWKNFSKNRTRENRESYLKTEPNRHRRPVKNVVVSDIDFGDLR